MHVLKFAITILSMLYAQNLFAGLLTIYLIPSARGLDFSSPRNFAFAIARNYRSGALLPYSHAMFHLKCSMDDGDGFDHDELSGVNIVSLESGNNEILYQGYGLGTLFSVLPGQMESRDTVLYNLRTYMPYGGASFLQYQINGPTCQRLTRFVIEYRQRGLEQNYGQALHPRYAEGSNCTSFVSALLEIAGLLDPGIDQVWSVYLRVPRYLVGGPLTGAFIPARTFILRPLITRFWAGPDDPHFPIRVYNTDRLHFHILTRWE